MSLGSLTAWVRLLRPKQWTKNLLVFAGLIFTGTFIYGVQDLRAVVAFFVMSFISSATYVVNDLFDIERDRRHPKKRSRPLASGQIGVPAAIATAVVLALVGLAGALWLGTDSVWVVLLYVGMQVAYNGGLKHVAITDVFCIAFGFVLRAALGAAAIHVRMSAWLLFCTGALALTLGFGKRRSEFVSQGDSRGASRESLDLYSGPALDALVLVSATSAMICYALYSLTSLTAKKYPALPLTTVFVAYGIARYILLMFGKNEGGEPETLLLKDPHMVGAVLLFVVAALLAVTGVHVPIIEP